MLFILLGSKLIIKSYDILVSYVAVACDLKKGSTVKNSKKFEEWDFWTAKFSGGASVPFLLLQMPQIILNANNLMSGNKTALLAVPWLVIFSPFPLLLLLFILLTRSFFICLIN